MKRPGLQFAFLALGLFLVTAPATPAAPAELAGSETGAAAPSWHIVRPGDTLDEILARYLGQGVERETGLRLNPQIRNPHRIYPGRRIRLFVDPRGSALPVARLDRVGDGVEELPRPVAWIEALDGDLLLEGDGLRTFDNGSAQLQFGDGSRVAATENALLFVRRPRELRAPDESKVLEVVRGRADLEMVAKSTATSRFEVILGAARASGEVEPGAPSTISRVRQAEKGTSSLMMYVGRAAISAQGARVEVPQGSGTSVPLGAPPRPVERLLEAPRILTPAEGQSLAYSNPVARWTEVAGAAAYQLEVCADPDCGRSVEVHSALQGSSFQPLLGIERGFLRVRALSSSGLDGYPSAPRGFVITELVPDVEAPTLSVRPGPWGQPPVVEATDQRSGVVGVWFTVDGGAERPIEALAEFVRSGTTGVIEAIARDEVGLETRSGPLPSGRDNTAPEIRVELVARQSSIAMPWRDELHFDWSARSPGWQPWRPAGERTGWHSRRGVGLSYSSVMGAASIDFEATRDFDVEGLAPLAKGRALRVSCSDAESGLERCSIARLAAAGESSIELQIEALDAAGNRATRRILLR